MSISFYLAGYEWVIIIAGLFLGLLGFRLFRISMFLIGIILGMAIGSYIGSQLDNQQLGLILGIAAGIILGFSSLFLIRTALFLLGAAGGLIISQLLINNLAYFVPGSREALILTAVSVLAAGLLTMALYKFLIIIITSLTGTYLIYIQTIGYFSGGKYNWVDFLYIILLAVFIVVQFGSRKNHEDPVEKAKNRRR